MKRIPIAAARQIADAYQARQVVIWAVDGDGMQHVTTYGVSLAECVDAALAGNRVKQAAGWPEELCNATPARAARKNGSGP